MIIGKIYLRILFNVLFILGVVGYIIYLVLNPHPLLWLTLVILVPPTVYIIASILRIILHLKELEEVTNTEPNQINGVIRNIRYDVTETRDLGKMYAYSIEVNGTWFQVSEGIEKQLSIGDVVSISYWPNAMTVDRVKIIKKITAIEERKRLEREQEKALARMRKSREEDSIQNKR